MEDNSTLSFGKRYGFEKNEIIFQTNNLDETLRTELWNAFYIYIIQPFNNSNYRDDTPYRIFHNVVWVHFFKRALDDYPAENFNRHVRNFIEKAEWYKVYEFFEFVFRNISDRDLYQQKDFEEYINIKLQSNRAGYTLLKDRFVPITNEMEVEEIRKIQNKKSVKGLEGVQQHLNASLELLSQKPQPDFRNSIKESISMVEAISRTIEPTENTLGKALNKLDKNKKINSTLKLGFEKLYAYTNDKNGIRHALMDEHDITFEDAKFFLVSCSAFTNYLIEKAKKEKLII